MCELTLAATLHAQTTAPSDLARGAYKSDGGFSFRATFGEQNVVLSRTSYDLPQRRQQRVMPAYLGASHPVLRVSFDPDARRTEVNRDAWEHQVASYQSPDGARTKVVLSRLSPAVLCESSGRKISLLAPDGSMDERRLTFLAFSFKSNVVVRRVAELANLEAIGLDEPWIVAWFGRGAPHRGYLGVIDVDDEHGGAGFGRDPHPTQPLDLPILLRLEHRPQRLVSETNGIKLEFVHSAGKLAIMPLFGGRLFTPEETEKWANVLPNEVVSQSRRWSALLRDFPIAVSETFAANVEQDTLTVRQSFTWSSFADDWKSPAVKAAPVPPLLALALGGGVPVTFRRDGQPVQPLDHQFMDTPGMAMTIEGADNFEYNVTGLRPYLSPRPEPKSVPEAARPLQQKLERHIREMVEAGHLQPLFYVYGGIAGARPAFFYWAGFAELAEAMHAAFPWLSQELQGKVREYLRSEFQLNPPFPLDLAKYLRGANRAPYEFPWDDAGRDTTPAHQRERMLREARAFGDLYGLAAFQELTNDTLDADRMRTRVNAMLTELLGQQDWALLGPVKPHSDRMDGFIGAAYFERNGQATLNGRLAGAIGLARLARPFGWAAEESWAWYLFGKLALARVAQARYVAEAHRMGLVQGDARDDWRTLIHIDSASAILLRGNPKPVVFEDQELPPFIDLVPEVGRLLGRHASAECGIYLHHLDRSMPLWYISEAPKQSASEQRLCPLQHKSGNVLAQFWILDRRGPAFLRYVDNTRFKGDLYYIKNLAAGIESWLGL